MESDQPTASRPPARSTRARRTIALTGGIASGKSTVADLLAERGAVIIDADLLAREVVAPQTPGLAAVIARFGPAIAPQGELDRAALGSIVFADADARAELEAIIHPRVRARAAELQALSPPDAVVVQVIPLLVETGQAGAFDLVVVVDVESEEQVRRLGLRNGLTVDQARGRIATQADRADRLAVADVVIDNSADPAALTGQVDRLWDTLVD